METDIEGGDTKEVGLQFDVVDKFSTRCFFSRSAYGNTLTYYLF